MYILIPRAINKKIIKSDIFKNIDNLNNVIKQLNLLDIDIYRIIPPSTPEDIDVDVDIFSDYVLFNKMNYILRHIVVLKFKLIEVIESVFSDYKFNKTRNQ